MKSSLGKVVWFSDNWVVYLATTFKKLFLGFKVQQIFQILETYHLITYFTPTLLKNGGELLQKSNV